MSRRGNLKILGVGVDFILTSSKSLTSKFVKVVFIKLPFTDKKINLKRETEGNTVNKKNGREMRVIRKG